MSLAVNLIPFTMTMIGLHFLQFKEYLQGITQITFTHAEYPESVLGQLPPGQLPPRQLPLDNYPWTITPRTSTPLGQIPPGQLPPQITEFPKHKSTKFTSHKVYKSRSLQVTKSTVERIALGQF